MNCDALIYLVALEPGPHGTYNFDHQSLIHSDLNYTTVQQSSSRLFLTIANRIPIRKTDGSVL